MEHPMLRCMHTLSTVPLLVTVRRCWVLWLSFWLPLIVFLLMQLTLLLTILMLVMSAVMFLTP